jgi:hypothetical protein
MKKSYCGNSGGHNTQLFVAEDIPDGTTSNTVLQEIVWTPTDLKGNIDSSKTATLRKGDSLLLTDTEEGTSLWIDTQAGGAPATFGGLPGDNFACKFDATGTFTITATVTKADNSTVKHYLLVKVLSVNLDGPIACEVGYQREKGVDIFGGVNADVSFTTNDSYLMDVSVKAPMTYGSRLFLKAKKRGTPILLARLPGANGPLLAMQEVDEFTLDKPFNKYVVVAEGSNVGSTRLTMNPYVPNLKFEFDMFSHTCTFSGGQTSLHVNSNSFIQFYNQTTGEVEGRFDFDIEVPTAEISYCFNTEILQQSHHGLDPIDPEPSNGDIVILSVKASPNPVAVNGKVTFTIKATSKRLATNPNQTLIDKIRTIFKVTGCTNPPGGENGKEGDAFKGFEVVVDKADMVGKDQLVGTATAYKEDGSFANSGDPKPVIKDEKVTVIKVECVAIKFDHKGPDGNITDGLNIRKNYDDDLEHQGNGVGDGEWLISGRNEPLAYVANQNVTLKAKFRVTPACSITAKIKADAEREAWFGVKETSVAFDAGTGESDYVEMPLSGTSPAMILQFFQKLTWKTTEINGQMCASTLNTTGPHAGVVVLDMPQAPWYLDFHSEPWWTVLGTLTQSGWGCSGSSNTKTVLDNITQHVYASGYIYETTEGRARYSVGGQFKLEQFMSEFGTKEVNCMDCARSVSSLSALLGCQPASMIISDNFPLNCIDPIGRGAAVPTNNCFATPAIDNDARQGGFGWHAVAVQETSVWDACLRVNLSTPRDCVKGSNHGPGTVANPLVFDWSLPIHMDAADYLSYLIDSWVHPTAGRQNVNATFTDADGFMVVGE